MMGRPMTPGAYLIELEGRRSNIKIFRQSHTGGPSAGRNRALAEATGEYVFFHDADDYLGADALRRLVGVAQQHASDVVAGRVSWIGRPEGEPGPTKTVFDADLLDDGVWRSLTPHKLIRRSLIEDHQLRFCDDMVQGEDQVFMASCLFAARKISILSDTDLYHRRMLTDGSNLSRQRQTLANKRLTTSRMVEVVAANTTPGARRDRLLRRVFVRTLPPALNRPFMAAKPAERKEFLEVMRAEVFPYLPYSVLGELRRSTTVESADRANRRGQGPRRAQPSAAFADAVWRGRATDLHARSAARPAAERCGSPDRGTAAVCGADLVSRFPVPQSIDTCDQSRGAWCSGGSAEPGCVAAGCG